MTVGRLGRTFPMIARPVLHLSREGLIFSQATSHATTGAVELYDILTPGREYDQLITNQLGQDVGNFTLSLSLIS